MKGSSAREPSAVDLRRLRAVAKRYHAKEIVPFNWRRGKICEFSKLTGKTWSQSNRKEIYG